MNMNRADHASIIVDEAMFRETYIPEKLHNRDFQVWEILRCLSPALKKRKPIHLWLHGKPGTGKTVTALHILKSLKEKSGINGLLINCWQKDTFFEILDEIICRLKIFRAEEHRTCLKLEKVRQHLKDQPFIIILDEFDQMRPTDRCATLYNLDSLGNVGIMCISSSQRALFELEERVRSRINPYSVFFPAYSCESLKQILGYRAELALVANAWSEKTLEQIVQMAGGDARIGIRTLRAAAELAEAEQSNKVSTHVLKKQWANARDAKRAYVLERLTEDHRILYGIVKQKREILSGQLWQKYLQRCAQFNRKPLASRTFSEYANRLIRAGLITSERARVKGKVRLFKIVGYKGY